ncbi:hypothetical protein GCM10027037_27580 [Mucilaginibacter koreensis]
MKKLILSIIAGGALFIAACNGTNQTGGAAQDSSQSNGNSGPADTLKALGQGTPASTSTGGSDMSSNGKGVSSPTVDSTKH